MTRVSLTSAELSLLLQALSELGGGMEDAPEEWHEAFARVEPKIRRALYRVRRAEGKPA